MDVNITKQAYDQMVAETLNEAAHESAKDLLDRIMEFDQDLNTLVGRQPLPAVIIDGVLMNNIQTRTIRLYLTALEISNETDTQDREQDSDPNPDPDPQPV